MSIDNAGYIGNMDVDSPMNSDPRAEGAGQMRAIKRAMQNSFPNITEEVKATAAQLNQLATVNISIGMILDWYGKYDNPPENWAFCDGSTLTLDNGTLYTVPDLTNKFVKCVSLDKDGNVIEDVGDTGGDHNGVAIHSHDHTHEKGSMEITGRMAYISETWGALGKTEGAFEWEGGIKAGKTPEDTDSSNTGACNFKASNSWSGETSEDKTEAGTDGGNQPEYMVLAKIIFVGPHVKP